MSTINDTKFDHVKTKYSKSAPIMFITLESVDTQRMRLTEAIKTGKSGKETIRSYARYINDAGIPCQAFFEAPEQFCFGINPTFPFGLTDEKEKTDDKIDGFQVCYMLNSNDTVEDPTEDETKFKMIADRMVELNKLAFEYESRKPKELKVVGPLVFNAFNSTRLDDGESIDYYIKPLCEHPNELVDKKKTGKKDTSKPLRTYLPLWSFGGPNKEQPLTLKAQIFGPDPSGKQGGEFQDKTGLAYRDKRGLIKPVIQWGGLYWGSHNSKPWVVNTQLKITECNFTPMVAATQKRFLTARPDLPACPIEDVDYDDADAQFDDPNGIDDTELLSNGDAKNPMEALQAESTPQRDPSPEVTPEKKEKKRTDKDKKKRTKHDKA